MITWHIPRFGLSKLRGSKDVFTSGVQWVRTSLFSTFMKCEAQLNLGGDLLAATAGWKPTSFFYLYFWTYGSFWSCSVFECNTDIQNHTDTPSFPWVTFFHPFSKPTNSVYKRKYLIIKNNYTYHNSGRWWIQKHNKPFLSTLCLKKNGTSIK